MLNYQESSMAHETKKYHASVWAPRRLGVCLVLMVFILVAYGEILKLEFVHYDHNVYVTETDTFKRG